MATNMGGIVPHFTLEIDGTTSNFNWTACAEKTRLEVRDAARAALLANPAAHVRVGFKGAGAPAVLADTTHDQTWLSD